MYVIPTYGWKSKLPSNESWPIGAESLTAALIDVPQLPHFRIIFHRPYRRKDDQRPAQVLTIAQDWRDSETWDIWTRPVARDMKRAVGDWLRYDAFPPIVAWLRQIDENKNRKPGLIEVSMDVPRGTIRLQHIPTPKSRPKPILTENLDDWQANLRENKPFMSLAGTVRGPRDLSTRKGFSRDSSPK